MFRKNKIVFNLFAKSNSGGFASYFLHFRCINVIFNASPSLVKFCQTTFDVPHYQIQSMMLQYPKLQGIEEARVKNVVSLLDTFGVSKKSILKYPSVLNVHPITIGSRWQILTEIGFQDINLNILTKYVSISRKFSISELQAKKLLPVECNIWDNLLKGFSLWPDVQLQMENHRFDISPHDNLCDVRMKILGIFLNLCVGLPKEVFESHLNTYISIKHKSFANISEIVYLLKTQVNFDTDKFITQGFLFLLDPPNVKMILAEVKELAGLNIKDIIFRNPVLLKKNYQDLLMIKKILKDEKIDEDEQRRNILVYSLNSETVQNRIREFKTSNVYTGLRENPRICHFIYSRSKVHDRVQVLAKINKKCTSLHKLISSQKEFERYAQDFGDKTKGVDVLRALKKIFTPDFNKESIRKELIKHPYWTYAPLPSIITVIEYLMNDFTLAEIFTNIQLILYTPAEVIKCTENLLETRAHMMNGLDLASQPLYHNISKDLQGIQLHSLNNAQLLGLVTYFLEKDHHFSCSGIWQKHLDKDVKVASE